MEDKSQILISDMGTTNTLKNQFRENKITARMLWYIYGNGNAERLSCIIDEVIEGNDEYRKIYTYQSGGTLQNYLSQFVEKKKDDLLQCVKKQEDDYSRTKQPLHYQISKYCGIIGLKSHLWHLLLLAVVSIKKSDLKFDLHSDKKVDSIGYCHDLIYNYLVGDECKNLVLGFLGFDTGHMTHMFPNFVRLLHMRLTSNRILVAMMMCFLKVAFYKNSCVADDFLQRKDPSIRTQRDLRNWQVAPFIFRERYYFCSTKEKHEYCGIEFMVQYLYLTEELENWFKRYKSDFIVFFGNTHINKSLQPDKNSLNKRQVDFSAFLPYLNKIKSFDDRYRADKQGFWKMFFPDKLVGVPIEEFSHCNELFLNITSYLSPNIIKEVWWNASWHLNGIVNTEMLVTNCQDMCPMHGNNYEDDAEKLVNFLCDNNRQIKIDEEKLSRYFRSAIIYFCEYNEKEWEKLSDQDKNFIKSVSEIIINRREEHFFESQGELDNSNKDVPDEFNQGFMFNDDNDDNDGKACDKILSDSEIKISFDISEEDKNPNQINFINEKLEYKNEILTNNSIKTTMNNVNQVSILGKIKDNLDGEAKPEQMQKSKSSCQIF